MVPNIFIYLLVLVLEYSYQIKEIILKMTNLIRNRKQGHRGTAEY